MSEKINKDNTRLYEIGFHIIPKIAEDKVENEYNIIKDLIAKFKGEFVKGSELKKFKLAYTIIKKHAGANERFNESYFAWIKFNMSSDHIIEFKENVEALENVLRFIVIKAVDDDEHSTIKIVEEEAEEKRQEEEDLEDSDESEDSDNLENEGLEEDSK